MYRKKHLLISILSLLLVHCQPMEFTSDSNSGNWNARGFNQSENFSLKGFDNFTNSFSSAKLDLVFVLDTQKGMMNFLKQDIFNEEFINKLNQYDWKMAYINASVEESLVQREASSPCGLGDYVANLGMGVMGVFTASGRLFGSSVGNTVDCVSSHSTKNKKGNNGEFLSFEKKGHKANKYLTPEDADHSLIFQDTFKVSNSFFMFRGFDAPQAQKGNPYPLTASLLSLVQGKDFFREDSQVLYVIFSPEETDENLSVKDLRFNFENLYEGGQERFNILPVTLTKENEVLCKNKLQKYGVKNPMMNQSLSQFLSKEVNAVDICSGNMGEEIQKEIAKFVYPKDLLSSSPSH